jgi:hypothetical protein
MTKTNEEMDEIFMECLRLRWGMEKIWKHTPVGKGRSAANCDGHPVNHRMGRREKLPQG